MNRALFVTIVTFMCVSMVFTQTTWKANVASRTILPTVNGKTDYVVALPPTDASSPGTFVRSFDVGEIAVGNGAAECHWVRDDLRVRVAAIGPDSSNRIAVFVSVEVYMFFYNDLQQFYELLRERVGDQVYKSLLMFVHAHHNHEGPDTSGISARPVNHKYYDYLMMQMVDATVEALDESRRVEVNLRYGSGVFYYGLGDGRDPRIQDARVRVMRAYPLTNGTEAAIPLFTMVQWGMHPEVTLGYSPDVNPANCSALPLRPPTGCAKNAVFTHDYPGHFSEQLVKLYGGGEALYFNGAIGVQIGNRGPVWEVDPDHPLGNGGTVPAGAEIVPENFRRAFLIGQQLATYVHGTIQDRPTPLPYSPFDYRSTDIWLRVTNFVFRVGLVPQTAIRPNGDPTRPLRLGNTLRQGYLCERDKPPSFQTCKSDNFGYMYDSVTGLPFRIGNYMQSEVRYLEIGGRMKFITIPGELAPELATGLPKDFDNPSSVSKYFKSPEEHVVGKDYTMPGSVMSMMECDADRPCWVLGLTLDEAGYMFPMSDWRVKCTAESEICSALNLKGALNFTDAMAGTACKYITEFPKLAQIDYNLQFDSETWTAINHTCIYGQANGIARGHYEETNAASWDLAEVYINAVAKLLNTTPRGRYCVTPETCAGLIPSPSAGN